MAGDRKVRVGSRKSELALIQTRHVIALLKELNPNVEFEIVTMNTLGDKILDVPLPKIGEKSLFTKELEAALANGNVDFVVHSLKDLPTTLPDGMAIGAVLKREDPRDALVLQKNLKDMELSTLPKGSIVGTSSLRRAAQLSRKYPHLKVESIRGNLNTRLHKLDELGKFQAIVLAVSGLHRMGWQSRVTKILPTDELLYAVGQGALAVECRENDSATIELLKPLYDTQTAIRVITERTFLRTLGGGCSAPVAISSDLLNDSGAKHKLHVIGAVWSLDGKDELQETAELVVNLNAKCTVCPYKNDSNDIECLGGCVKDDDDDCEYDKPCKLRKTDAEPVPRSDIPIELLKNDPHEHCPVPLPVGAEFMGKCPYLESNANIDISKLGDVNNVSKCPYVKAAETVDNKSSTNITGVNSNLFCGLVPHSNVNINVLEQAQKLGVELAEKLIAKGALEIMAKAQAHIRNT